MKVTISSTANTAPQDWVIDSSTCRFSPEPLFMPFRAYSDRNIKFLLHTFKWCPFPPYDVTLLTAQLHTPHDAGPVNSLIPLSTLEKEVNRSEIPEIESAVYIRVLD
jgi:hypothetical protein